MERIPNYPVRKATSLIVACNSIKEIETIKNAIVQDMNSYSLSDQGFLMTLIGLQIIKLEDGEGNFDRFFRGCFFASFIQSTDN
jgi:hypothetical protein